MNTNNHLLLDEFLEGKLTLSERKKFLTKLESDSDLLRLVEAERVIKQSVISDKHELDSVDHSATYSFLLAGLAASSVAIAGASTSATAATKSTTAKSIGSSFFGGSKSAILSLTVSVVASTAIGVATYQLRNSNNDQPQQVEPIRSNKITPVPVLDEPRSPVVALPDLPPKKGITQKQNKSIVKNGNKEVFHDIYGDVIESTSNLSKNPAPK